MCFTVSCKINKAIKIVFSSGDRYISSSGNEEKETILDGKFTCLGTYCHKYSYIQVKWLRQSQSHVICSANF